jgi:hypothetical protein
MNEGCEKCNGLTPPPGARCKFCGRQSAQSAPHHCHAKGCSVEVKPELLMCYKHWRMVPKAIQKKVWEHYRPGQCNDKNPSKEWHQAADEAIKYVYEKEKQ